jgi:hypothetical protein
MPALHARIRQAHLRDACLELSALRGVALLAGLPLRVQLRLEALQLTARLQQQLLV